MPGAKMVEAEQRQSREDQGQRVTDGRRIVEAGGELAEDRRADADDHGEHQNLHPGRDHVAQHLLGEEGGAAEEAERHQDEARERGQLELDQADEELDRHDEEADDDDQPGDQQDRDLDEVVEEAGEAHQTGDGGEDGLSGVDTDLSETARLKQLRLAQRPAARLDAEAGEGVVDDLSEIVEVADDEGEDADIEGLLDQAREHVLVGRHGPEEAGQGDVDRDEHTGEPAHIALHEPEAGIDVLGEDPQETVDDAGAAHRSMVLGFRRKARVGRWRGRGGWRRAIGEEATPVLRPGGFAGTVILRGHADRLAARQFARERIALDRR